MCAAAFGGHLREIFVLLAMSILAESAAFGAQYTATVSVIEAPNYNVDCAYFQLTGVPEADPVHPGNPWFGIPRTQNGYNEIYALLLGAKLSGSTVVVQTTGVVAGGACSSYAGVAWIDLH